MMCIRCSFSDELSLIAAKAAKSDKNESRHLPLCAHMIDTYAVMDALVSDWLPFAPENSLGMNHEQFRKCSLFLAAIHDLGKATPAFQSLISDAIPDHKNKLSSRTLSLNFEHTREKLELYGHHPLLGSQLLLHYTKCSEELAVIVASHHGYTPKEEFCEFDDDDVDLVEFALNRSFFLSSASESAKKWESLQKELISFAYKISDFNDDLLRIKIPIHAQSVISGLLIMSDWLSSNEDYFPLIGSDQDFSSINIEERLKAGVDKIRLPGKWRPNSAAMRELFKQRFPFEPRKFQEAILDKFDKDSQVPKLVILEAPMGIGKTELALAIAERMAHAHQKSGLAFFLPSQATSNGIFPRLLAWSQSLEKTDALAVRLSHGNSHLNIPFCNVPNEVKYTTSEGMPDVIAHSFFKSGKSSLLANIVVGTIDQFLLGAVAHRHVMLRHLGLTGKVVVIDECHAYDAYMSAFLDSTLSILGKCGVPVILLSATLTAKRRSELNAAYLANKVSHRPKPSMIETSSLGILPYPILTADGCVTDLSQFIDVRKTVQIERIRNDRDSILAILENCSGCVCVIVNTVSAAQNLFEFLSSSCADKDIVLCHSQYTNADRQRWENGVLNRSGKNSADSARKNLVVIGTQVLEQSLDLDFDLMISEICPMDFLLQRIGRLHRHDRIRPTECKMPKCFVISDSMNNVSIYPKYLLSKTLDCLPSEIHLPEDISRLVEMVYSEQGNDAYGEMFQEFKNKIRLNYEEANRYSLKFNESRICKTFAGKIDRNSCTDENGALVSVRQGTPSLEAIVISMDENNRVFTLEGDYICESADDWLSSDRISKLLKQKIRLPHALSHAGIFESVVNVLNDIPDLGKWRKHPLLKNEIIMPLECSANGYVGEFTFKDVTYELDYNQIYGLRTTKK